MKKEAMLDRDAVKELKDELRMIASIANYLVENLGDVGRRLDVEEEKILNMAKTRIAGKMIDEMQFAMFKGNNVHAAEVASHISDWLLAD